METPVRFNEIASRMAGALLLAAALALSSRAAEPEHPFRFGFSTALMPDVKENDARAAMKAWADTMVRNKVVNANPDILVFPDFASMAGALRSREVDGVTASTADYFALRNEVAFNRFVFSVTDGTIFDEYVLLVHHDSDLAKVEDLRGRSLNVLKQTRTCLAPIWLDTFLLERGLEPAENFCRLADQTKLTQAVLPVFFRKVDACLVTRKGFQTMCELNPQVGRQLRVLCTSPEFVPSGFFFRSGYPPQQQERFLAELTRVHLSPTGQQILTVFQTERLEERPPDVLDSALALLERHRQLLAGTNTVKNGDTKGGPL